MILYVPLAFLAAALLVQVVELPWWAALLPLAGGGAALLVARRVWHVAAGLALVAGAIGGLCVDLARASSPPSALARLLAGQEVVAVRGVVEEEPVPRGRSQQLRLRVDAIRFADGEWATTAGHAHVAARPVPLYEVGDVLELRGAVRPPDQTAPPGYAAYLRRQGVDALLSFPSAILLGNEPPDHFHALLLAVREHLTRSIEMLLPEPQAALVEGILVGRRATIPRELTEAFNRSGTSHITAVSGFNVSLAISVALTTIGGLFSTRAWRRWLTVGLASAALWTFVALVGASGSVLRAAAMAQLALIGRGLGRSGTAGSLLLWGAAFLAAWQPTILLDVGWQLSFLGTAGLIWIAPAVAQRLRWLPGAVREPLAATLAAQICVLPVLASTFGQVSLIAPLANVLALPLVPAIMLGGGLLVLAAAVAPPIAPLCAALTWVPTTLLIRVVEWSAAVPGATLATLPWSPALVASYLLILVALCSYLQYRADDTTGRPVMLAPAARSQWLPNVAFGALAAAVCVAWLAAPPVEAGQQPTLRLSVPAVADGSLVLVRAPDGTRVLLNGGPTIASASGSLGEALRPWDRTVDVVLLTDPRESHLLGLTQVLERNRVGLLLDAVEDHPSAAYRQVRDAAQRRGIRRLSLADLTAGGAQSAQLSAGNTLSAEVIPLPGANAVPAVRLSWGTFGLLVPGDGTPSRLRALLSGPAALQSTALLLSERASRDPATPSLLRAVSPDLVIVQGTPPKTAPAAALPAASSDDPQPTWHRTAAEGPLHLEVSPSGYRLR